MSWISLYNLQLKIQFLVLIFYHSDIILVEIKKHK